MKNAPHLTHEEMVLSIDGEIAAIDYARIETHLANCSTCLSRYEELAGLSERLNHAIETAPVVAAAAARQRLEAALTTSTPIRPIRPLPLWKWSAVAVAAALVLVALLVRQTPTPQRPTADVTKRPLRATLPPESVAESRRPFRAQAKQSTRMRASSRASESNDDGFIRLPYSDPALPLDSSDVVRVQMHLSALANTGVVRAYPGVSDPLVQADVLVGLDGQPSAIRIVQPGPSDN